MMRRDRSPDDPSIAEISTREILVAWGLLGLIVLYAVVSGPSCSGIGSAVDSVTPEAEARHVVTASDDYENDADRRATLAGLDEDREITSPNSIGPPAGGHVQRCELAREIPAAAPPKG